MKSEENRSCYSRANETLEREYLSPPVHTENAILIDFRSIQFVSLVMSVELIAEPRSKRRRILIISGDESVIEEIQRSSKLSLCKSAILETLDEEVHTSPAKVLLTTTTVPCSLRLPANTAVKKKTTTRNEGLTCVICDSPASGFNFDVVSCESCKSFFRRNALKQPVRVPLFVLRAQLMLLSSFIASALSSPRCLWDDTGAAPCLFRLSPEEVLRRWHATRTNLDGTDTFVNFSLNNLKWFPRPNKKQRHVVAGSPTQQWLHQAMNSWCPQHHQPSLLEL